MFSGSKTRFSLPPSSVGCITDRGLVREQNEDSVLEKLSGDGRWRLLVVCDGMGGHQGGKTASSLAAATIERVFFGQLGSTPPADALRVAVEEANRCIWEAAQQQQELAGMGTTVVALATDSTTAHLVHVGDSRAYRIRVSEIRRMTKDHSNVQRMVDAGMLAPQEAAAHPDSNVLYRCLGQNPTVEVELKTCPVEKGDRFLLCTDGLHGLVEEKIIAAMTSMYSANEGAAKLVELAKSRGGTDNVSVIVYHRTDGNKPTGIFKPEKFGIAFDWLEQNKPQEKRANPNKIILNLAAFLVTLAVGGSWMAYKIYNPSIRQIEMIEPPISPVDDKSSESKEPSQDSVNQREEDDTDLEMRAPDSSVSKTEKKPELTPTSGAKQLKNPPLSDERREPQNGK